MVKSADINLISAYDHLIESYSKQYFPSDSVKQFTTLAR